jgi:hypothetical protein
VRIPSGPVDKALKWTATVILIVGSLINGLGYYPLGPLILTAGGAVWLIVACRWREPSMIVTNAVMFVAGAGGLLFNLIK